MSAEYLAYLIKHDSVHGRFKGQVESRDGKLFFENNEIKLSKERDPSSIRWTDTGADFVCESTGAFCTFDLASKHVNRSVFARFSLFSPFFFLFSPFLFIFWPSFVVFSFFFFVCSFLGAFRRFSAIFGPQMRPGRFAVFWPFSSFFGAI